MFFLNSSNLFQVNKANNDLYNVCNNEKTDIVHLKNKTCTCNKFQLDEIPCEHALAVLRMLNQEPYSYCSSFYTKESMQATYGGTVYPVPSQSTWIVPIEVRNILLLPPKGRIRPGRPKKRRIQAPWENKNINKCSTCGYYGHNKKTCRNAPKKS